MPRLPRGIPGAGAPRARAPQDVPHKRPSKSQYKAAGVRWDQGFIVARQEIDGERVEFVRFLKEPSARYWAEKASACVRKYETVEVFEIDGCWAYKVRPRARGLDPWPR